MSKFVSLNWFAHGLDKYWWGEFSVMFNEAISLHLGNTVPWMVKLVDIWYWEYVFNAWFFVFDCTSSDLSIGHGPCINQAIKPPDHPPNQAKSAID